MGSEVIISVSWEMGFYQHEVTFIKAYVQLGNLQLGLACI